MSIYYQDDRVTLHHGDALEVLRGLPDESVDSVVTDPPYGLEFMGKDWDRFDGSGLWTRKGEQGQQGRIDGKGGMDTFGDRPQYRAGRPFQDWCEQWTAECLRVLKPGGHLLAFGGTRTWHRLACAVEDAGFEVRDSIAWLYGSGFPKSLDVSKAIDKAAGAERDIPRSLSAAGEGYDPKGRLTGRASATQWCESCGRSRGSQPSNCQCSTTGTPATPDAERWQGWGTALKPAFEPVVVARKPLGGSVSIRSRVEYELRQRGVEGEIQWTTTEHANGAAKAATPTTSSATPARPAAATSAAPADESETPNDERPTANGSARRTPSGAQPTASTSAPTHAAGPPSSATRSSTHTATSAPAAGSESGCSSPSITSTEAAQPTGKRSDARSTSRSSAKDSPTVTGSFAGIATGLIGSSPTVHIDRLADGTFVWPDGLPEVVTAGSTVAANVLQHGTGALNIDACRVGSSGGVRGDVGGGSFRFHGFSSLAELRTAAAEGRACPDGRDARATLARFEQQRADAGPVQSAGRWPTNVVLDDSQAAALDEQSGERPGASSNSATSKSIWGSGGAGVELQPGYGDTGGASRFFKVISQTPSDFPTFRYEAKAPATERPRYKREGAGESRVIEGASGKVRECRQCGNRTIRSGETEPACGHGDFMFVPTKDRGDFVAHPTVKPLDLMRWLVRLVTPPGGTVLEPFAGSGTTVEACIVEGFHCIAIEREADYLPLIMQRVNRRRDPVAYIKAAGDDLGLFDLEGLA